MGWLALVVILVLIIALIYKVQLSEERKVAAMSPEERAKYQQKRADDRRNWESNRQEQKAFFAHGLLNTQMICPHCQTKGAVRTMGVKKKKGISGAKATVAVITGGVSVLATGLSRKENLTQAHCENCGSDWLF